MKVRLKWKCPVFLFSPVTSVFWRCMVEYQGVISVELKPLVLKSLKIEVSGWSLKLLHLQLGSIISMLWKYALFLYQVWYKIAVCVMLICLANSRATQKRLCLRRGGSWFECWFECKLGCNGNWWIHQHFESSCQCGISHCANSLQSKMRMCFRRHIAVFGVVGGSGLGLQI